MDPSGIGRLITGASPGVNSRGALRSNDSRWIVSRLSERYLFGRPPACRCCSGKTFTSRHNTSEDCGVNAETGLSTAALSAGGVAGQRLATANRPNTASTNSSVLFIRKTKTFTKGTEVQRHKVLFCAFVLLCLFVAKGFMVRISGDTLLKRGSQRSCAGCC